MPNQFELEKSSRKGNRVAVGLLAYSRPRELAATLDSLAVLHISGATIFLLQNGMPDVDFTQIESEYPWITAIHSTENLGAAAGRNRLIELVLKKNFDWLFMIDADIVLAPDALPILLIAHENLENPGLVSCLVRFIDEPDRVLLAGMNLDLSTYQVTYYTEVPETDICERQAVCTAAILVACRTLKNGPRFDERFFIYAEDLDWCLQLGQLGYKHYVVRDAAAYHPKIGSRAHHPVLIYLMTRNHLLLLKKSGLSFTHPIALRFILSNLVHAFRRILGLSDLSVNGLVAVLLAYFHAFIGHWGKAPNFFHRPPENFLEYRFQRLVFQPKVVARVKDIFGAKLPLGSRWR